MWIKTWRSWHELKSGDFKIWINIQVYRWTPNYDETSSNPQNVTCLNFVRGTKSRSGFEFSWWSPSVFWNHITRVCGMHVRVEYLMRAAINLKQNNFYEHVCSKKNLTGGTLMGRTCTNLPPLTRTLFVEGNQQTWHSFKAGHCFRVH